MYILIKKKKLGGAMPLVQVSLRPCIDTVKTKWDKHRIDKNAAGIVPKIESCGSALKRWSSRNFGSIRRELQQKQKLLAKAELKASLTGVNFHARMLRSEVNDLLDKVYRVLYLYIL